jgi:hypothetical protein
MTSTVIEVRRVADDPLAFAVVVREAKSETRHHVAWMASTAR